MIGMHVSDLAKTVIVTFACAPQTVLDKKIFKHAFFVLLIDRLR